MNDNRGSLTIIAIFTILIFSLYGILLYARSASAYIRQSKSIEKIQQVYAQDIPNAARIAEQLGAASTYVGDYYTITFDANGGTLNNSSKQIAYSDQYGELPIPTKEGYTFVGWHNEKSKNLLNINTFESIPSDIAFSNTTKRTFTPNTFILGLAYNNYYGWYSKIKNSLLIDSNKIGFKTSSGYGIAYPLLSSDNKTYTFSFTVNSEGQGYVSVICYKEDGTVISWKRIPAINEKYTFTTPSETYYLVIGIVSEGIDVNVSANNLQLEEGNVATTYEPYCVTSNMSYLFHEDTTLYAVWKPNE